MYLKDENTNYNNVLKISKHNEPYRVESILIEKERPKLNAQITLNEKKNYLPLLINIFLLKFFLLHVKFRVCINPIFICHNILNLLFIIVYLSNYFLVH